MSLRLYLDQNRGERRLAAELIHHGVHVVRCADEGLAEATDEDHLIFAAARDLAVYTADGNDFPRLHWEWLTSGREHAGIIIVPFLAPLGAQLQALLAIQQVLPANEGLSNRLVRLADWFD